MPPGLRLPKGTKSDSRCSSAMPTPSSATRSSTSLPSAAARVRALTRTARFLRPLRVRLGRVLEGRSAAPAGGRIGRPPRESRRPRPMREGDLSRCARAEPLQQLRPRLSDDRRQALVCECELRCGWRARARGRAHRKDEATRSRTAAPPAPPCVRCSAPGRSTQRGARPSAEVDRRLRLLHLVLELGGEALHRVVGRALREQTRPLAVARVNLPQELGENPLLLADSRSVTLPLRAAMPGGLGGGAYVAIARLRGAARASRRTPRAGEGIAHIGHGEPDDRARVARAEGREPRPARPRSRPSRREARRRTRGQRASPLAHRRRRLPAGGSARVTLRPSRRGNEPVAPTPRCTKASRPLRCARRDPLTGLERPRGNQLAEVGVLMPRTWMRAAFAEAWAGSELCNDHAGAALRAARPARTASRAPRR